MESGVKIEIHHGGEFCNQDEIIYYKGGTVDYIYNQSWDNMSISMLESFIRNHLGYEVFKIYWYKSGVLFDKNGYQLLWNDDGFKQMCAYTLSTGFVDIYVDHTFENKEAETERDEENEESDEENEESTEESDDDGEAHINDIEAHTDDDEEFDEIMKRKKKVCDSKSNPIEINVSDFEVEYSNKKVAQNEDREDNIGWESEYESDSFKLVELQSSDSSDNEVNSVNPEKHNRSEKASTTYNPKTPMKNIEFERGLIFTDVATLKNAIIDYAVEQKREIWFKKNDLQRIQAKCRDNCPWYLFASRVDIGGAFQVKSYIKEHRCILVHKHKFVRSDWLARKFGNKVRANPKWKLREFQQHVNEVHSLVISKNQCLLAKKLALSEIDEEIAKQYKRLYDYGAEVMRSNPGSTVKVSVERSDQNSLGTFKSIYICFAALKEGFKQGCRRIIGLDGCFLKSYVKGELLTAVGRDGNNQMFPIAWALEQHIGYFWMQCH